MLADFCIKNKILSRGTVGKFRSLFPLAIERKKHGWEYLVNYSHKIDYSKLKLLY